MKGLVDKVKSGIRKAAVGTAIGLAAMSYSPKSAEGALVINNFMDLIFTPGAQHVKMEIDYSAQTLDNLMIRDSETGLDSIVEGDWHMGFVNYIPGGAEVVGYANQPYAGASGANGFMSGNYHTGVGDGNRPDDVWLVNDGNGDGIGLLYANGTWVLGDDDTFYGSNDILFGNNQVRGDVGQLPVYTAGTSDNAILPHMIVSDRFPRTGPAGVRDLEVLGENWLRQDCDPYDNADCDGADWNYDGKVNLQDSSRMAQGWDPNYIAPPRTGPAGMEDLVALSENWLRQDCQLYGVNSCDGADWDFDGDVDFEDFSYMAQGWDPNYVSE